MKTLVSINLKTCNRLELTKKAISSIRKIKGVEFELIVVDNHSTDGTVDYLLEERQKMENMVIIFNNQNLGVSIASNQSMAASKGDFILFIDNDCEVKENILVEALDYYEKFPEISLFCLLYDALGDNGYGHRTTLRTLTSGGKKLHIRPCGLQSGFFFHKSLADTVKFDERSKFGVDDVVFCFAVANANLLLGVVDEKKSLLVHHGQSHDYDFTHYPL